MISQITQSKAQVRKTWMAVMVTTITSMVIVTSMIILSNFKPNDVFGANHPGKPAIKKASLIQHMDK